jgi:hypothetical protein
MWIVFAIDEPNQRRRIDYIRERATGCFASCEVTFGEDISYLRVYLTVTVTPDPPYGAAFQRVVFPGERAVFWDWPEPISS